MTIEPQSVAELDRAVKTQGLPSRSKALGVALNYWLAEQRRQQVEREIEEYYRSQTVREKHEDREWVGFASMQAGRSRD